MGKIYNSRRRVMIWALAIHLFMSWLCAWLKGRKKKEIGVFTRFDWGLFGFCLCGMWFIVPESWDNYWMDKDKE